MEPDLDEYVADDWGERLARYREEHGSGTISRLADDRLVRRDRDGEVPGEKISVFERVGDDLDWWRLTRVAVYADGLLAAGSSWWSLYEFVDDIRDARIRPQPPEGAQFYVRVRSTRITAAAESIDRGITPSELIREICDIIDRTNDRADSSERCIRAAVAMARNPTDANRQALDRAFHSVPEHRRRFILGDQDRKDGPIRGLLADDRGPRFEDARRYFLESNRFDSP